jgi:uncharacterized lipoprotein YmbA
MSARRPAGLAAWTLAAALAACASHPVEHLYTVAGPATAAGESVAGTSVPAGVPALAVVAVATVALPELIDRAQMVTRTAEHEVVVLENQRWAGPLADDLTRALIADLQRANPGAEFVAAEGPRAPDAAQRIEVQIEELMAGPEPVVSLQASWAVRDRSHKAVGQGRFGHKVTMRVPMRGGAGSISAGYAEAMQALAQAIARAMPR